MKKDNVYRFTLQFPGKTEEQIQAGEFLERLGSKKSKFLVNVVSEYLQTHPEAMESNPKIHLETVRFSRDELKSILQELLAERGYNIESMTKPDNQTEFSNNEDVDDMLANLDLFFQ